MILIVDRHATVRGVYSEAIDLTRIGVVAIRRASHVEPDEQGRWWADLSPSQGPRFGPFALRSAALDAERQWLEARLLNGTLSRSNIPSS